MTEALKRVGADLKVRIKAILANRIGVSLTLPKRIVQAAAAVVSLVVPIATSAIDAALTAAQLPALPGPSTGRAFSIPVRADSPVNPP